MHMLRQPFMHGLFLTLLVLGRLGVAAQLDSGGEPLGNHPAGEHHHHGDKDDRHDAPGSPCHHHDEHCDFTMADDASMIAPQHVVVHHGDVGRRAAPAPEDGELPGLPCEVFHPPLA